MTPSVTGHQPAPDMRDLVHALRALGAFIRRQQEISKASRTGQAYPAESLAAHLHETATVLATAVDRGTHPWGREHYDATIRQLDGVRARADAEGHGLGDFPDPVHTARSRRQAAVLGWRGELRRREENGERIGYDERHACLTERVAVYELLLRAGDPDLSAEDIDRARRELTDHTEHEPQRDQN
ncbi:hypothetical protein [Streptomyces sp. NPDC001889]